MTKRAILTAAVALAGAVALADDKIGTSKAPEILRKVQTELSRKQGYRFTEKVGAPQARGQVPEQNFEGVVKKDFAAVKGSIEAWCKGSVTLVRNGQGRIVEPRQLEMQQSAVAAALKNPAVVTATVIRFGAGSRFTGEEKLGEAECKIAETAADPKTTEEQIREYMRNIKLPAEVGTMDLTGFVDKKKCASTYKAWVGKEDLLFHRIEWTLTIVIDRKKIPPGFADQLPIPENLDVKTVIDVKDYDQELDVEIPKEIRARFGMK